jgi:hypothetical protein
MKLRVVIRTGDNELVEGDLVGPDSLAGFWLFRPLGSDRLWTVHRDDIVEHETKEKSIRENPNRD